MPEEAELMALPKENINTQDTWCPNQEGGVRKENQTGALKIESITVEI